jgi:hypothetical protein
MKLVVKNIHKSPIAFSALLIYILWWIFGIIYFTSRDFPNDIAGGISVFLFVSISILISGILLVTYKIASKRIPEKKRIYNRYSVFLAAPYLIFLLSLVVRIGISSYLNRYQEDSTQFSFDQLNISDATQRELLTGSTQIISPNQVGLGKSLYPFSTQNVGQPLIFVRKEISVLPLEVTYFYDKENEVVKCIIYEWSEYQIQGNAPDLNNRGLRNKYRSIMKNLSTHLGLPKIHNANPENEPMVPFKSLWQKDKLNATLTMYLSQSSIRCTIYWNE